MSGLNIEPCSMPFLTCFQAETPFLSTNLSHLFARKDSIHDSTLPLTPYIPWALWWDYGVEWCQRLSQSPIRLHLFVFFHNNIERHTAHTIVSWPNSKQWVIVHTYDLMMIISQSIYSLHHHKDISKMKTHSPIYCITDNWENMLNLTHTLNKIYLTGILEVQCLQTSSA